MQREQCLQKHRSGSPLICPAIRGWKKETEWETRMQRERNRRTQTPGVTWLQNKLIKVPLTREELKRTCFHSADSRHKQSITINLPSLPSSFSWSSELVLTLCLIPLHSSRPFSPICSSFFFQIFYPFVLYPSQWTCTDRQKRKKKKNFKARIPSAFPPPFLPHRWPKQDSLVKSVLCLIWVPGLWVTTWRRHRSIWQRQSVCLIKPLRHSFANGFHFDLTASKRHSHQNLLNRKLTMHAVDLLKNAHRAHSDELNSNLRLHCFESVAIFGTELSSPSSKGNTVKTLLPVQSFLKFQC